MIFLCKRDGTLLPFTTSTLSQGSVSSYDIVLLAPFPSSSVVSISFKLPNGVVTKRDLVSLSPSYALKDDDGNTFNAWRYEGDLDFTSLSGPLRVQFFFLDGYGQVTPSTMATVTVGRGVPYIPEEASAADVAVVASYLAAAALIKDQMQQEANAALAASLGWATGYKYNVEATEGATANTTLFLFAVGYTMGDYSFIKTDGVWYMNGAVVDLNTYGVNAGEAEAFTVTASLIPDPEYDGHNAKHYADQAKDAASQIGEAVVTVENLMGISTDRNTESVKSALGWATGEKFAVITTAGTVDENVFLAAVAYKAGAYTFENASKEWTLNGKVIDISLYGIDPQNTNSITVSVQIEKDTNEDAPWYNNNSKHYAGNQTIGDGTITEEKLSYDLAKKVDNAVQSTTIDGVVYGRNGGENVNVPFTQAVRGDNVVQRLSNGHILVPLNPYNDSQAVNYGTVRPIVEAFPQEASANNPLVSQDALSTAIEMAAAAFRGNWANFAAVPSAAADYPSDGASGTTPKRNDYIVVQDSSDYTASTLVGTWRFKYSGDWDANGKNGWRPEYKISGEVLTSAQIAALNSGVSSEWKSNTEAEIDDKVDGSIAQDPHAVLIGPSSGSSAPPTFRPLELSDIPRIDTAPTPSTIAVRNAEGRLTTEAPVYSRDCVNLYYFQENIPTLASLGVTVQPSLINLLENARSNIQEQIDDKYQMAPVNSFTVLAGPTQMASGMPSFRALTALDLPGTGTPNATPSSVVMRDGNMRFKAASPVDSNDVATKAYVDGRSTGLEHLTASVYDLNKVPDIIQKTLAIKPPRTFLAGGTSDIAEVPEYRYIYLSDVNFMSPSGAAVSLPIKDGGTGAATVADALVNLGLTSMSKNVEANTIVQRTATGTVKGASPQEENDLVTLGYFLANQSQGGSSSLYMHDLECSSIGGDGAYFEGSMRIISTRATPYDMITAAEVFAGCVSIEGKVFNTGDLTGYTTQIKSGRAGTAFSYVVHPVSGGAVDLLTTFTVAVYDSDDEMDVYKFTTAQNFTDTVSIVN